MLQFAVFDHLDHNGTSLGEQLEGRLRLIGVLEAEGYYAYHVAEHHSTRLGMAPSPNVFLAAVAHCSSISAMGLIRRRHRRCITRHSRS